MNITREKQPWGRSITMSPFPLDHKQLGTRKLIAEVPDTGASRFLVSGVFITSRFTASDIIGLSTAMRQLVELGKKEKKPPKGAKARKAARK